MADQKTPTGSEVAVVTPGPGALAPATPKPVSALASAVLAESGKSIKEMQESMKGVNDAIMANIGDGEIQVARLAIAQPGTPEVAEKHDGWDAGMLFDSGSREPVTSSMKPPWLLAKGVPDSELRAKHILPVVCIFKLPSEYVLWPNKEERETGTKMFHWKDLEVSPRVRAGLWRPKGTWQGDGSPPVTEHLNILMLGLNMDASIKTNFLIDSFSRTSFKAGKKLVTDLNAHRMNNLPWWGRVYYLTTESAKNDRGQVYYFMSIAKGPKLEEFGDLENATRTYMQCYQQALQLADQQSGRALQEMMLNVADFDADAESTVDSAPQDAGSSDSDNPTF